MGISPKNFVGKVFYICWLSDAESHPKPDIFADLKNE